MAEDDLTTLLGEAVRDLVLFIEHRPEGADTSFDVRALEGFADLMSHVPPRDRVRVRRLLGDEVYGYLGWD